jgi:hypothetical protein
MFVIETAKVPEELRALNQPGGGVISWAALSAEDARLDLPAPGDLLAALTEAFYSEDWEVIRELIRDMKGDPDASA